MDCGSDANALLRHTAAVGFAPESVLGVLATHGHFDHLSAASQLIDAGCGSVWLHEAEAPAMRRGEPLMTCAYLYGGPRSVPVANELVGDGLVRFGSRSIEVVHTPGHSPGSVSYLVDCGDTRIALLGDALWGGFHPRIGSDLDVWEQTLSKLQTLKCDALSFGHGPPRLIAPYGEKIAYAQRRFGFLCNPWDLPAGGPTRGFLNDRACPGPIVYRGEWRSSWIAARRPDRGGDDHRLSSSPPCSAARTSSTLISSRPGSAAAVRVAAPPAQSARWRGRSAAAPTPPAGSGRRGRPTGCQAPSRGARRRCRRTAPAPRRRRPRPAREVGPAGEHRTRGQSRRPGEARGEARSPRPPVTTHRRPAAASARATAAQRSRRPAPGGAGRARVDDGRAGAASGAARRRPQVQVGRVGGDARSASSSRHQRATSCSRRHAGPSQRHLGRAEGDQPPRRAASSARGSRARGRAG